MGFGDSNCRGSCLRKRFGAICSGFMHKGFGMPSDEVLRHETQSIILKFRLSNIGALIIRIGFWGPVYYTYNKEPPK